MKKIALIAFLAWAAASSTRAATNVTSAADYFNLGAATFIRQDPEQALAIVNEGLLLHPEDEPLVQLKALLEQQQEQEQQQQDQQQENEQEKEDANKSDQSDPSEEDQPQDQDQDQDQPPEEQDQQEEQPAPGDMTEQEAEMVLDSLRQLEEAQRNELMQEMIRRQMRDMPPVEKDW